MTVDAAQPARRFRRAVRVALATALLGLAGVVMLPTAAHAQVVYWDDTVAQDYADCSVIQSGELEIESPERGEFDTPPINIGGLIPGSCFQLVGDFITNSTDVPVTVTAADVYDAGTIAPFINEFFGPDWVDRTIEKPLAPGESTAEFSL